jgi:hypothetical protein
LIPKHSVRFTYLFLLKIDFVLLLGTWLKQRQHKDKEEEQQQPIKETNNPVEKSSNSSSGNSSDSSSITTNGPDIPSLHMFPNFRKTNAKRPQSAALRGQGLLPEKPSIIKEIVNTTHPWEYDDWANQPDPTGPLTKSALIYRLMRSRLEANLAKSISANRKRSNKKKLSSSTAT